MKKTINIFSFLWVLFLILFSMQSQVYADSNLGKTSFLQSILESQLPILDQGSEIEISVEDLESDMEEGGSENLTFASKPMNTSNKVTTMTEEPLVLIYHTHASEAYIDTADEGSYRTVDTNKNMVAIGERMKEVLESEYGIKVIHDTSLHDVPSYNNSYTNSLASAQKILEENPSIKYVFDLHRDGVSNTESAIAKYQATMGSVDVSKVMMVLGLNHENSNFNVAFANTIEDTFDEMYPGLCLPTVKREEYKYNQFLSNNAVLMEVGSNLITFKEAEITASYIGHVVGNIISEDVKKE